MEGRGTSEADPVASTSDYYPGESMRQFFCRARMRAVAQLAQTTLRRLDDEEAEKSIDEFLAEDRQTSRLEELRLGGQRVGSSSKSSNSR
jgi:hypothetical protein